MMKKNVLVLGVLLSLLLGSCQGLFTPTPPTGPTVDSAATSDALFKTAVAQTLTARPSLSPASTTEAATLPVASPSSSPVVPATDTQTTTATQGLATPADLTATLPTGTGVIPTATGGPANVTPSGTATLVVGQTTAIWTLAVRKYGTLPPDVPFRQITLVNRAKAEAYISLHVDLDGSNTVIEYPVTGRIKIDAPVGFYTYVAWVGGRKMVGEFKLHNNEDLTITLFRDKVVIK
jgi:hypothetical protein